MGNAALLVEASDAIGGLQRGVADALGVSTRTVQRMYASGCHLDDLEWQALARAVHPGHPELAARLAREGGSSPEAMGLVARPPPGAEASVAHVQHMTDGVVCVAAEAADLTPGAIRPALLAAVRRARQVCLTLEDLEGALAAPRAPKAAVARRKG
jgi:hypothetical protein